MELPIFLKKIALRTFSTDLRTLMKFKLSQPPTDGKKYIFN